MGGLDVADNVIYGASAGCNVGLFRFTPGRRGNDNVSFRVPAVFHGPLFWYTPAWHGIGVLLVTDNVSYRGSAGFIGSLFSHTPAWRGIGGLGVADNVSCGASACFLGSLFRHTPSWRGMAWLGVADNVSYICSVGFTAGRGGCGLVGFLPDSVSYCAAFLGYACLLPSHSWLLLVIFLCLF